MRFIALASLILLLTSCSEKKTQEFVGDSIVSRSAVNSGQQPTVQSVTEESDTLDVPDSCIIAYEPTATQQQQLLKANPDCEEALADFEFYTGSLSDSLRGRLPVFYTSSRYWRIRRLSGAELQDTREWIGRNQAKDIGVAFLCGAKRPFVMTDVATTPDYYQTIEKLYRIHIAYSDKEDSKQ